MNLRALYGKVKRILKRKQEIISPIYIPVLHGELLKNKNVLITGGGSGIGYAIAKACLQNRANVIITGRDLAKLQKACQELQNEVEDGFIDHFVLDNLNFQSFDENIRKITNSFPTKGIDILVNNAGVSAAADIGATSLSDYDNVLDINLKGTYFLSQTFANFLISEESEGTIINISSSSGNRPAVSPYMVSKWGIVGLTKGMAKKYIDKGIRVNAIAPGPTATGMLANSANGLYHSKSPAKRFADAAEIANLAVFMMSDMGRMIVGETIYMTGGCGTLTYDDVSY